MNISRIRRRKPTKAWISFALICSCMGFLCSCVYIPPVWDGGDEIYSIDSIRPGVTTREEVLIRLGQPDTQDRSGKLIEYSGTKSKGLILVAFGDGGGFLGREQWAVLIQFDDNDVVTSVSTSSFAALAAKLAKSGPPVPDRNMSSNPSVDLRREAGIYCPNADLGHADAQLRIGRIHDYGAYGMKVDQVRAWVWYSLAGYNGDEVAMEEATRLTEELDPEQLVEARRQLAEWGPGQCAQEMTRVDLWQEVE